MPSKRAGAAILAALLIAVFVAVAYAAQGPQRVVILPFTANAKEDINYIVKSVRDMLASRLAWRDKVTVVEPDLVAPVMKRIPPPYNDDTARKLGKELSADVVVFGSISALGKAVSVDARVVQTKKGAEPLTAYVQASDLDQVIPRINDFAMRINAELFKRPEAVAAQKQKSSDTLNRYLGEQGQKQQAEPEKKASGEGSALDKLPPNISPLNPLFMRALSGIESDRYWRSPRIKGLLTSLAVADIDLDGKNELLALQPHKLLVYRLNKEHFALVNQLRNGPKGTYLFVDAADIDGNGRPEIYVSNLNENTLQSFVLEAQPNGGLAYRAKDLSYYFRIQPNPVSGKPMLLAQGKTLDSAFLGPVYEMKWDGDSLKPKRELKLPKLANIYNFAKADMNGSGAAMTVLVMPNNDLQVYSASGESLYQSGGEVWCASDKFVKMPPESELGHTSEDDIWQFLPTRIVVHDLNNDHRQSVLVVRNRDRFGEYMDKLRIYFQGTLFSMFWNGMSLAEDWRTPRINGYVTDYGIADVGNVGKQALYMAVSQRQSKDFTSLTTGHIVAFTLKPMSKAEKERARKKFIQREKSLR